MGGLFGTVGGLAELLRDRPPDDDGARDAAARAADEAADVAAANAPAPDN
jgi:hypothetical protein